MKLLSLNLWGGSRGTILFDYLKQQSAEVDIFCFQEVFSALPRAPQVSAGGRMFLFQELGELLKDFNGFFDPRATGYDFNGPVEFPVSHGLAIFVRKNLSIISCRSEIIEQTKSVDEPVEGWTKAQILTVEYRGRQLSIINFHGVAQPGNKLDTRQRIAHTKRLLLIWDSLPDEAKILCGDFNLYPGTECIKELERLGKNLIKEFKIKNTRNQISWDAYPNSNQTFADFTFVSNDLDVKSFEVPYNEVSDHLPMILQFDI